MGGILEDALDGVGIEGVAVTSYPATQAGWTTEIGTIFKMIYKMRKVGTLGTSAIKTKAANTGAMLNLMKGTTMLGETVFDEVIDSFIMRTDYYKSASKPYGIFDDQYLTDMKSWSQYDWEGELVLVGEYELESDTQEGRMIDQMATSALLRPLIADEANKYIAIVNEKLLDAFEPPLAPQLDPLDVDEVLARAQTTTWEREIRALEAVIAQIDAETNPGAYDLAADDKTDSTGDYKTIGWYICEVINDLSN